MLRPPGAAAGQDLKSGRYCCTCKYHAAAVSLPKTMIGGACSCGVAQSSATSNSELKQSRRHTQQNAEKENAVQQQYVLLLHDQGTRPKAPKSSSPSESPLLSENKSKLRTHKHTAHDSRFRFYCLLLLTRNCRPSNYKGHSVLQHSSPC